LFDARIGLGHDTHRLAAGGPLRIGGIDLDYSMHAVGHSDADVLLHAITDALLGGANLGDIGELFPDSHTDNRGRDSGEMLQIAWGKVKNDGWELGNLDCVVHAQAAKIKPVRTEIRQRIAGLLGVEPSRVGVKGKTGEQVGPVGREEAISAQCVALLFAAKNE
jgi:2-C-methyl-D-erythritol 2,4-cyclodiphosphate synthase